MAVTCLSCDYGNNDDARFCAGCGTPLGTTCAACGTLVPPGGRFCPNCGTPLQDDVAAEPPVEERRVVSILFADLAGFTSRSDHADPEDVRRTLMPFHAIAKEEIERFGGALDKFIGDAAMGVFGAPVAHEDDAERAVRAALAIQARAAEMAIPVRAAVNSGEAVVTFATGPQVGENVAGDVVEHRVTPAVGGAPRRRRGRRVHVPGHARRGELSGARAGHRERARRSRCACGSWSAARRRARDAPTRTRRRSSDVRRSGAS